MERRDLDSFKELFRNFQSTAQIPIRTFQLRSRCDSNGATAERRETETGKRRRENYFKTNDFFVVIGDT